MRSSTSYCFFFFFNDTATTEIYTLSLTTLFRSCWHRSLQDDAGGGRFAPFHRRTERFGAARRRNGRGGRGGARGTIDGLFQRKYWMKKLSPRRTQRSKRRIRSVERWRLAAKEL